MKQVAPVETDTQWQVACFGDWIWKLRAEVDHAEEWLRDPVRLANRAEMLLRTPVPGSGTRVVRIESSIGRLVLKEYRATNLREVFKSFLRGPRSWRALQMALRLRDLGVPALEPFAAGYAPRKPWHSFLVTRELGPIVAAKRYAQESPRQRRQVIRLLAQLMASLHRSGLVHGDAHIQNFVWQDSETPRLVMVDVDAVRECRQVSLRQAVRDLGRLLDYTQATPREMIRFAIEYCRQRGHQLRARELVNAMQTSRVKP